MRPSDDRGLVGKIVVLGLALVAIVVIVAVDGGSILLARSRAEDLADDASASASQAYRETGDEDDGSARASFDDSHRDRVQ